MRQYSLAIKTFICVLLLSLSTGMNVHAGNGIESAGEVLTALLPATALGLTVGYKDGEGMLQFGLSSALTLGVTYGLKSTVIETDPNGNSYSFPSSHTSISFSSAEFIRKRYGWLYGLPSYAAATFVAVSRVTSREHYIQDVAAGAAIGILSSCIFTQPFKGWLIQPEVGEKHYGLRLGHAW
ncbi:MAG TPA: phosphatase PAP2 family protein [Syntrophorhabdaceae bacterium]|nr:phosphatase PAP2 family protein [Syntrophorhabdaceae bacterium]